MTQIESAKNQKYTQEMKIISKNEDLNLNLLRQRICKGRIVIPHNNRRKISKLCGIGYGLTTKVNANIGTSPSRLQFKNELRKLEIAIRYGADTVMDLSIGGDLKKIRKEIIQHSCVPIGTVPIYEAAVNAERKYGSFLKMSASFVAKTERQPALVAMTSRTSATAMIALASTSMDCAPLYI